MGALMGFPTKALPQLRNETDVNVNLDDYQGSMFASVSFITGIKTVYTQNFQNPPACLCIRLNRVI